ncbi:MAG TPA: SH3 domain-containing protein [Chloroflexi bacterium]|nr:SH3 domain-containing protein [Chloroflexota bacterium]
MNGKSLYYAARFTAGQTVRNNRGVTFLLLLMLALIVGGCTASAATMQNAASMADAALPPAITTVIEPLDAYQSPGDDSKSPLPTPTATPTSAAPLRIVIASQVRANLRSGPGTSFDIVAKANPGLTFDVLGRSEDGGWYQVATNVAGITPVEGQTADKGWVAAELVRIAGEGEAPVVAAASDLLLKPDLSAEWAVSWKCDSERCQIKECEAEVKAVVNRAVSNGYLPVEHTVTWDDACFSTDAWTFEVNQVTGKERTGEAEQNFLYGYWLGAKPGDPTGVLPLADGKGVEVYCTGPHTVEIEEGAGWTTVYQGNTCHDVNTGLLAYMNYTKRWLYTGDYDGKTYARAFFGDIEHLEQRLVTANVPLALVEKKK